MTKYQMKVTLNDPQTEGEAHPGREDTACLVTLVVAAEA